MKIKEVTIGMSQTISIADYQNIKPSVNITAVMEESDDYEKLAMTVGVEFYALVISMLAEVGERDTTKYRKLNRWAKENQERYSNGLQTKVQT